jgi:hypothetical protein
MQRFKYQALVTPFADDDGDARSKLSSGSHRMVLRAENSETHRSQVFQALVDGEEGGPFRVGSPQIMVTLRVIGDDVPTISKSAVTSASGPGMISGGACDQAAPSVDPYL